MTRLLLLLLLLVVLLSVLSLEVVVAFSPLHHATINTNSRLFRTTTTIITTTTSKPPRTTSTTTRLFGNTDNIRNALEATERYGIHSPEAKFAWEIVEEFDGRDNSAAYQPNFETTMSPEQLARAYDDVQQSMELLQRQREGRGRGPNSSSRNVFDHNPALMNEIAAELQAVKLTPPSRRPAPQIPGLWDAKLQARAMSEQYGLTSVEAKLAWEEVEELAAAGLDNALAVGGSGGGGGDMYETCNLGQAAEACLALEELERYLDFEYEHQQQEEEKQEQQHQYPQQQHQQHQQHHQQYQQQYQQQYPQQQYQQEDMYNYDYNEGYDGSATNHGWNDAADGGNINNGSGSRGDGYY